MILIKTQATVSGNEFADNVVVRPTGQGGAGLSAMYSSFRVENNIFTRNFSANDGGGVRVWSVPQAGTEQVVVNNTFFHNYAAHFGGGIRVASAPNVLVLNNILWSDTAAGGGHEISVDGSIMGVEYCDVAGGYNGTGNINVDPKFADSTFRLSDSSNCIGAGVDSVQIASVWYREPVTCFYGSPRPNPAGSKPDIGACENARANPLTGVLETGPGLPAVFTLEQNYPNPFNPSTLIRYSLPNRSHVTLSVFNTLGQQVAQLVNGDMEAGYHEVQFDGRGLSSGLYFYRMQAGSYVETRKLLLVR